MKKKLKDIVNIQTGIYRKPEPVGDTYYIQIKHIDNSGTLRTTSDLTKDILLDDKSYKHLLSKGNILFAAKGTRNIAYTYNGEVSPAIASTMFFTLCLNNENIAKPEYISWFINLPSSQEWLKARAKGSGIPSISKAVLEEFEISIPTIHKQELILKISNLRNTEKELIQQIENLKEQQVQQLITNAII
jgi:restriction endonuclease S subunit